MPPTVLIYVGDLSCSQTIIAVKRGPHWEGKDASLGAGTSASSHHPRGAQQSWQRLLVVALTWKPVAPDYPYSLVSRELRGTIRGLLAKAVGSLELFFDHCLFTMLQELDKTPGETGPCGIAQPRRLGCLLPFTCVKSGWVVLFLEMYSSRHSFVGRRREGGRRRVGLAGPGFWAHT